MFVVFLQLENGKTNTLMLLRKVRSVFLRLCKKPCRPNTYRDDTKRPQNGVKTIKGRHY